MPANKYALLRYRIIDRCLTNPGKPFPTKEELRQACGDALYGSDGEHISISTVEKTSGPCATKQTLDFTRPLNTTETNEAITTPRKGTTSMTCNSTMTTPTPSVLRPTR